MKHSHAHPRRPNAICPSDVRVIPSGARQISADDFGMHLSSGYDGLLGKQWPERSSRTVRRVFLQNSRDESFEIYSPLCARHPRPDSDSH